MKNTKKERFDQSTKEVDDAFISASKCEIELLFKSAFEPIIDQLLKFPKESSPFMTKEEVAEYFRCSVRAVETHLYSRKDLPYHKIAGKVRVKKSDLEEFVKILKVPCIHDEILP